MRKWMNKLMGQFRMPHGYIGYGLAYSMNWGHASLSEWALQNMILSPDACVLDIGCGGGGNIRRYLKIAPQGRIFGIDISTASVKVSRCINRKALGDRCWIYYARAEKLPFQDGMFDIVSAFETIYFWQDPGTAFQEIYRSLKPGGQCMMVCEMVDTTSFWARASDMLHIYSAEQIKRFYEANGFQDIQMKVGQRGVFMVVGHKPF